MHCWLLLAQTKAVGWLQLQAIGLGHHIDGCDRRADLDDHHDQRYSYSAAPGPTGGSRLAAPVVGIHRDGSDQNSDRCRGDWDRDGGPRAS